MSVLSVAAPVVSILADVLRGSKASVAKQTGLSEDVVGQVSDAMELYLTKDERALQAMMAEIDKARAHDTAMNATDMPPVVLLLRGLVRPVITLVAFFWYVYARAAGLPLEGEDYAIIGGILAFWFGFRPFEKPVEAVSGKAATLAAKIVGAR